MLLRLDTDWYSSTKHEIEHVYPRLSMHGVLLLDDYGHYQGARRAIDEYFDQLKNVRSSPASIIHAGPLNLNNNRISMIIALGAGARRRQNDE
jgi:hypothetical protein